MIYLHTVAYVFASLFLIILANAVFGNPKKKLTDTVKKNIADGEKKGLSMFSFDYVGTISVQALNKKNAEKQFLDFKRKQSELKQG